MPYGFVVGPLSFLVYINDLQNNTILKALSFADNTLVYIFNLKKTITKQTQHTLIHN